MNRRQRLKANLESVEARLAAACSLAGRRRSEVRLVAVTKYVDVETVRELPELGVREFGESRPQELWKKANALPDLNWHLVGHLQRNKVERSLTLATLIHSVDSLRLLEAIHAAAVMQSIKAKVLLEVHLTSEATKQGFNVNDLSVIGDRLSQWPHMEIHGLMTMAALGAPAAEARRSFACLRELRDRLRSQWPLSACLSELSMGMTADFEAAIQEGATLVRIGSALFEGMCIGASA